MTRSLPGTTLLLGASVALYQGCYFSGISRLGVSMGSIVTVATVPVATGIVAYLLRKEKPVGRWYVATALAIAGLLASSGAVGETRADLLGFMCLTAGSSVSPYTVLSRQLLDAGAPVTEVTTIAVALSGVLLLLNARGLQTVSATAVATLNLAEPLAAVILAFVVLHERPSAAQVAGAAAIFVGLLLLSRQPRRETADDNCGDRVLEEVASGAPARPRG
ncbi:DMT family transporter [Streptomyces alboniger]|uniref:EamA domain-containing protein n=1 Tax=Streptomyces alboniger TaxID=132473 RepID=A0A5J6HA00_STRAD|nr:DMT family transporter [Streptomyces alboniger]QEV16438.1 hypothetical protein CP975_02005 [Streptomyces alboniger]